MHTVGVDQIAAGPARPPRRGRGARRRAAISGVLALLLGSGCGLGKIVDGMDEDDDGVGDSVDCAADDGTIGVAPLYVDLDGDGHGVGEQIDVGCAGTPGRALTNDDCDDDNAEVWELADWYLDQDGDGFGQDPGASACESVSTGYASRGGDCVDTDATVYPGAPPLCDGIDNDCDGLADDTCGLPSGQLSSAEADWVLHGSEDAQLGISAVGAGDVDCDETDDLLVGAPNADGDQGAVVLAYGSDEALQWTLGDESGRVAVLTGAVEGGGFGTSVAGNADFDGDDCVDLVIGAPQEGTQDIDVGGTGVGSPRGESVLKGRLYVALGPWYAPEGEVSRTWGVEALEGEPYSALGTSITCSADLLDDGHPDCAVGAPLRSLDDAEQVGAVLVLSPPGLSGETAEDQAGLTVLGTSAGERLGSATGAGDLDGDGVPDLILGASTDLDSGDSAVLHRTRIGRVYVILNVPRGAYQVEDVADVWMDGVSQDGTGLAIASGVDLEGDGHDDLALGAPRYAGVEEDAGRVLIVSGAALMGLTGEVADVEEVAQVTLEGQEASQELGQSVAWVEDLGGDPTAELLVGAPGDKDSRGAIFLFLDPIGGTLVPDDASLSVIGDAAGEGAGYAVSASADLNGLGRADLIAGSYNLDDSNELGRAGTAIAVLTDAW